MLTKSSKIILGAIAVIVLFAVFDSASAAEDKLLSRNRRGFGSLTWRGRMGMGGGNNAMVTTNNKAVLIAVPIDSIDTALLENLSEKRGLAAFSFGRSGRMGLGSIGRQRVVKNNDNSGGR